MNRERRKEILGIIASLEDLAMQIGTIVEMIDGAKSDEEEYRDNIPENLQRSERYYRAEASAEALSSAYDEIEAFDFEAVISSLREAME
ncbi:glucose-6-phosphate isomerase [Sphingobium wenxiniae]|uniref:Uncharacterized protein n=1 Tax=Sphingobium wenxiniae (strain DSM 21828 / CGMCC 1.7748 / JZ-1) TaxID=595605 RepID=A0A562KCT4_SPHWJ|nr:hypothetical protein [Sphingobium wenxiniae]MBB6191489.1 glucose-6-phosphate isomerase [Sphingobium wenxiniae]TWH93220.1 hypothetical protein IQ35_02127 [Sphingobium wenxiniae]